MNGNEPTVRFAVHRAVVFRFSAMMSQHPAYLWMSASQTLKPHATSSLARSRGKLAIPSILNPKLNSSPSKMQDSESEASQVLRMTFEPLPPDHKLEP